MDGDGLPPPPRLPPRSDPGVSRPSLAGPEALLRAALDAGRIGLILLDPFTNVRLVTRMAGELLGVAIGAEMNGLPAMRLFAQSHFLDEPALQTLAACIAGLPERGREILLPLPAPIGSRTVSLELIPLGEVGSMIRLEDVSQQREVQAWRHAQATTDPVTGLAHRQHFLASLAERLEEKEGSASVLRLRLRRFKTVNQALGQAGGDALLRLVAGRLGNYLRGSDLLARYGAVEFAMLIMGCHDRVALRRVAERLVEFISKPYLIEGQLVSVGASVGLACAPEDGSSAERLIANAGLALAAAEAEARGGPRFYEPNLDEAARRRQEIERDLQAALAGGEFELHYQPQIDLSTREVRVFEALIRWRGPKGMVPPGEFIPVAEDIGLIGPLGDWVLEQACRDAATWPEGIAVAVNVSPLQFHGNLARSVARALERSGLPGSRLEVEITESLLLHGHDSVDATFQALRSMGVAIVLDDFGTGYAALSQLARFRFDKIKIDRSFISAPDAAAQHGAIVRAIAALGTSLHVPTTAEGVETEAQLAQILRDGCTQVQGYYFSRPVPADEVGELLARFSREKLPVR